MTRILMLLAATLILSGCGSSEEPPGQPAAESTFPVPQIEYEPSQYVCTYAKTCPDIDGRLDDACWQAATRTDLFVDIEGDLQPAPRFETRAMMLWDSQYFYIAAQMEEPHLWGTLTERDAVIYHDNDFEVFIDPDGDSHEYYELEINGLGTEWDLLLVRPYRDGAPAVNAWDIQGLKTALYLDGTLNDPSDTDVGWSVEIAIPWSVLGECAHRPSPPNDGDTWWVNFSRVQWQLDIVDGKYTKTLDSITGRSLPENNWVWSPQGLIAMHYPEMWGLVQFSTHSGGNAPEFEAPEDLAARWHLRQLYYAQKQHQASAGRFTSSFRALELKNPGLEDYIWPPQMHATGTWFEASLVRKDGAQTLSIRTDGRLTAEPIRGE